VVEVGCKCSGDGVELVLDHDVDVILTQARPHESRAVSQPRWLMDWEKGYSSVGGSGGGDVDGDLPMYAISTLIGLTGRDLLLASSRRWSALRGGAEAIFVRVRVQESPALGRSRFDVLIRGSCGSFEPRECPGHRYGRDEPRAAAAGMWTLGQWW
jgi:hypothetical protein